MMARLEAQPPARRPHAVPVTARRSIRGERSRMVRRAEGCFLGRKIASTLDMHTACSECRGDSHPRQGLEDWPASRACSAAWI